MKILNVRFRNINSLKGDWEISFEREPLADAGIFAITGPTGAGKTSILDAITLALYGETPRLGKKPSRQIMTRNTEDCFTEVTFAVNNETYRSRWGARVPAEAAPGEYIPPFMELISVNGSEQVVENKLTAVRSKVSEIIGMDFKRFTRSAMLSQGEFAVFLNAKEKEREEILEKITGAEVYDEISEKTTEKTVSAREDIQQLNAKIESLAIPDARETEAVRDVIRDRRIRLQETEAEFSELKRQFQRKGRIEQLEKEFEERRVYLETVSERKDQMAGEEERLEKARAALLHRPTLETLETRNRQIAENAARLEQLEAEIEPLETLVAELDEKRDVCVRETGEAENVLSENEDTYRQVKSLDDNIEAGKETIRKLGNQLEFHKEDLKDRTRDRSENEKTLGKRETEERKIEKWLASHETYERLKNDLPDIEKKLGEFAESRKLGAYLSGKLKKTKKSRKKAESALEKAKNSVEKIQGKADRAAVHMENVEKEIRQLTAVTPEEMRRQIRERKKEIERHRAMIGLIDRRAVLYAEKDRDEEHIRTLEREFEENIGKKNALVADVKQLTSQSLALEKTAQKEERIRQFDTERLRLKEGEACPCCGAVEHPFAKASPPMVVSGRKLEQGRKKVRKYREELQALSEKTEQIRTQIGQIKLSLDNFDGKLERLDREFSAVARATGKSWSWSDTGAMRSEIRELEEENRRQGDVLKSVEKLTAKHDDAVRAWEKTKDLPALKKVEITELESMIRECDKALAEQESEIRRIQDKERGQADGVAIRLKNYGEDVPSAGAEMKLAEAFGKRQMEWEQHEKDLAGLKSSIRLMREKNKLLADEEAELERKIRETERQISDEKETLSSLEKKRAEVYGERSPGAERNKLLTDWKTKKDEMDEVVRNLDEKSTLIGQKKERLRVRKAEHERIANQIGELEKELLEKVSSAGFTDIEDMRNHMIPADRQHEMLREIREAEEKIAHAKFRLDEAGHRLSAERGTAPPDKSPEEISAEMNRLEEAREELEAEVRAEQMKIREHESAKQEHAMLIEKIAARKKELEEWEYFERLRGTAEGPEFKRAVQAKTLDRLLGKSNIYLRKLSGRFSLVRHADKPLEIEIRDAYMKAEPRPPGTLSGGESFLVSLAMALGLSDLSAEKTRMDSLFLDENFGLLDEDTLGVVFSTLKSLRVGGKTIGVISHVEALKERIPTQIRVEKRMDEPGTSRLSVE